MAVFSENGLVVHQDGRELSRTVSFGDFCSCVVLFSFSGFKTMSVRKLCSSLLTFHWAICRN